MLRKTFTLKELKKHFITGARNKDLEIELQINISIKILFLLF